MLSFLKSKLPLLALAYGLPAAQETLSSLQRELDRVERETEREKELHKTERARAAEFEKRKAEKLQAIREQTRLAEARIDSLKRKSESERRRKAGQKGQAALFQAKQKEFRAAIAKEIEASIAWLQKDFPYQKEKRLSEWGELAKANQEGSLPVEETVARLFSLAQATLDFAQDTEAYPGSYTATDGTQYEGIYVSLGAVMLAFASGDGKQAAYLARSDSGYAWRDGELPAEARQGIRMAVQVAQGKEPPKLVPLPLEAPKAKAVEP